MLKSFSLTLLLLFITACSDNALVTIYDKKIVESKIPCMKLLLLPSDEKIETLLENLYKFDESCSFTFEVSQNSGIVCNSNQNIDKKALSNFPSAYLKMVLYKDGGLVYSYYIDLHQDVEVENIIDGFERVKQDLHL